MRGARPRQYVHCVEKKHRNPGRVVCTCNLGSQEAAVGGEPQVQSQPGLRSEFKASLGIRHYLKKQKCQAWWLHTLNLSTWEMKTGGLGVQSHWLHRAFRASLAYMRSCLLKTFKPRKKYQRDLVLSSFCVMSPELFYTK